MIVVLEDIVEGLDEGLSGRLGPRPDHLPKKRDQPVFRGCFVYCPKIA